MDDSLLVSRRERLGDLPCNRQRLVERDRSARDAIGQRRAVHVLEHQRRRGAGLLHAVDRGDVRMIEGGQDLRFALEARQAFGVVRHLGQQHLDGDLAFQARVGCPIHGPHAAFAEQGGDLVGPDAGARRDCHVHAR